VTVPSGPVVPARSPLTVTVAFAAGSVDPPAALALTLVFALVASYPDVGPPYEYKRKIAKADIARLSPINGVTGPATLCRRRTGGRQSAGCDRIR